MTNKKLKLADIAELAGVSKSTVSFVLNGHAKKHRINQTTVEKVEQIARDNNYSPSIYARALKSQKTYTAGLVIPDLANMGFARIAKKLEQLCRSNGYQLLIASSEDDPQLEKQAIESLVDRQVDVLLIATSMTDDSFFAQIRSSAPIILFDRVVENGTFTSIKTDAKGATEQVVTQLVEGLDECIYIGGQLELSPSKERFAGFKSGLEKAGVPFSADKVFSKDYQPQSGYQMLEQAVTEGRDYLSHRESSRLLDLYDIPCVNSRYANDIGEVVDAAKHLGGSVAVKALHKDNVYPFCYDETSSQRWKDLALDLYSINEVRHSATKLAYRVSERYRDDETHGYCVQQMKRGFQSMQVNLGVTRDPTFGPVILFGAGGYTTDVLADRQVMLPPLNMALARELVNRSRISKIVRESSYQPEKDIDQICEVLCKISEMVVDLPQLESLEINPLLLNKRGVLAVDMAASISAEPAKLSISPYPEHLTENIQLKRSKRPAIVRAIRGEDEPNHLAFYNTLSPESIRMRYFYSRGVPTHQELAYWTQIDYDREMAFIISAEKEDRSGYETLGVVRAVTDADNIRSEFSVVIRDELQGEGLGVILMQKIIDYCRSRGTLQIVGSTLPSNRGMQGLAKKLGFQNSYNMEEDVVDMKMTLNEASEDWQIYRLQH